MKDTPEDADIRVGANIRQLRALRGISQEKLGEQLGVTFQQIQKYEKGTNRISASRLVMAAKVLKVRIEVLFAGVVDTNDGDADVFPTVSREATTLAQDFEAITDPAVRLSIRGLVKSLSRQQVANAA
ncbi:helix-turn-helix domain-containing protein [Pararhizobium sp. BT-229]|uniref:helix-turn-helix domain-containing protein n=1 Tax=Pararhizobium sp. BT-229 TaxID=2986923 RepID=UPI0021F7482C|nr:helix-turn-helix transcriptional regulator [Pararhizobium sp. BT-229]MCV9960766.1 helix-turn-helix domain-containing protein [Pararhizobium sp. BT-229]